MIVRDRKGGSAFELEKAYILVRWKLEIVCIVQCFSIEDDGQRGYYMGLRLNISNGSVTVLVSYN